MKRLILDARVTMVSLCRRGKNKLTTLYKSDDGARLQALVKADDSFDDKGQLLAVVAAPGLDDVDGDQFVSPEAIAKSAHSFLQAGGDLDIEHDGKKLDREDVFVAESFVIQKSDERFQGWPDYDGNPTDVAGGWGMLIQINSDELRKSYRAGDWDGVSLYAPKAHLRELSKSDNTMVDELRKFFTDEGIIPRNSDTGEIDMDVKELAEVLKANNEALIEGIAKAVKVEEAPAATDDNDDGAPEFKGDPTNRKDVEAHLASLRKHDLRKSVDFSDAEAVSALLEDESDDSNKDESDELKKARARVAELEKASNLPAGKDDADEEKDVSREPLVKAQLVKPENAHKLSEARAAAAEANDRRFKTRS